MIRSFTGAQARPTDLARVQKVLASLSNADCYVTGACIGMDAYIGQWLWYNRTYANHQVIVPGKTRKVDYWWDRLFHGSYPTNFLVRYMPADSNYRDRNVALVEVCDELVGFPAYDAARSPRSGSWQTLRLADAADKLASWHTICAPYLDVFGSLVAV